MSDLIDRQAAIDALVEILDRPNHAEFLYGDEICGVLGSLPSAQPEQRWIPITSRPMDDEERKEWSEKVGYELEGDDAVIYTSQLPEDGQECIVSTKRENVSTDMFQNDPDYGCYFEDHGGMDGITAWMPLPKPWKGEKDEQ